MKTLTEKKCEGKFKGGVLTNVRLGLFDSFLLLQKRTKKGAF